MKQIKRILPALLIIILILSTTHYFIFHVTTRSLGEHQDFYSIFKWVLIAGVSLIPVGFILGLTTYKKKLFFIQWISYIWMGIFHFLFFISILEWILFLFFDHNKSYWVIAASGLLGLYSLFQGLKEPELMTHTLEGPEQISGLKLAQISDLHIGMLHLNQSWLKKIVDRINHMNPDIIAITGDLVEGEFSEVSPQLQCLAELKPRLHKYYITGNHEYIHGSGPWEKRLAELGFIVLHNTHHECIYNNSLVLVAGVPDRMVRRFNPELHSSPDQALMTLKDPVYKILLAHEPASVWDIKKHSCDLILSGHTHGGQMFPFGFFVRLVQPFVNGFKKINNILVFAHEGTGFWGPPFRFLSRSEIVLFNWKKK